MEQFFTQAVSKIVQDNPQEIVKRLENLENIEEWRILRKILVEAREGVIQNLKQASLNQEVLIAYKESITAIDFLINLPKELVQMITLNYLTEKKEEL